MPRRTATVTIAAEGRDQGKTFLITEMPSDKGEEWACRLLLALGKSGVQVDEHIFSMGMAGIAAMGVQAMGHLPWEVAKPLMAEMFECIRIMPDSKHPNVVRPLIVDDIEEVATRLRLRDEVINLHIGFSVADFISNLRKLSSALAEQATARAFEPGEDTAMSQSQLEE
jgi:hypothetical protein